MKLQEKKIIKLLDDFKQDKEKRLKSLMFNKSYKFSFNDGDYDEKRLIRYIFKRFLNFTIWDKPFEKTNWEIPMKYKGINVSFTHQKFGFSLYIDSVMSATEAEHIYTDITYKIRLILHLIEPSIREQGIKSLHEGDVIIENKLATLEDEFNFFLKETAKRRKISNMPTTLKLSDKKMNVNFSLLCSTTT